MKLFRLKYKGLSGTPAGENRKLVNKFFVESLVGYISAEGITIPNYLKIGQLPDFRYGKHGKPYFNSSELSNIFFSLSHTKDFVGLVFAKSEIGFDCENISARNYPKEKLEKISNRVFSADEVEYCFSESSLNEDEEVANRFFEIWTAKEAYSKFTGNGFAEGFRDFSVMNMIGNTITSNSIDDDELSIRYAICGNEAELSKND